MHKCVYNKPSYGQWEIYITMPLLFIVLFLYFEYNNTNLYLNARCPLRKELKRQKR